MKTFRLLHSTLKLSTQEINSITHVFSNRIFIAGSLIKLLFLFFIVPVAHTDLFFLFLEKLTLSNYLNPWDSFLASGGNPASFPYGTPVVFIFTLFSSVGLINDSSLYISSISITFLCLVFDALILVGLIILLAGKNINNLLVLYWLNPVVLFSTYYSGHLDLIPLFALIASITLLKSERYALFSILLSVSIASKYSMVIAAPFLFIYCLKNPRVRPCFRRIILIFIPSILVLFIPIIYSNGFLRMVIVPPVVSQSFTSSLLRINVGGNYIYTTFVAYALSLYALFRTKRSSIDTLFAAISLSFISIIFTSYLNPSWFVWIIPFTSYLISKDNNLSKRIYLFFLAAYTIYFGFQNIVTNYNLRYSFGGRIDLLQHALYTILISSAILLFAILIGSSLTRGKLLSNFNKPYLIGLAGNSSQSNNITSQALTHLFGIHNSALIDSNIYQKSVSSSSVWNNFSRYDFRSFNLNSFYEDLKYILGIAGRTNYENSSQYLLINSKRKDFYRQKRKEWFICSGYQTFGYRKLANLFDLKFMLLIGNLDKDWTSSTKYTTNNSDFSIHIMPINSTLDDSELITSSRAKLLLKMNYGLFEQELCRSLIALSGAHIETNLDIEEGSTSIFIEGDLSSDDLRQIALLLVADYESLVADDNSWRDGYLGLTQLIVLLYTSEVILLK